MQEDFGAKSMLGRRRRWHPTPVLLSGKSHGWRSLVGCSPWGRQESDTTERLHFHFPLPCTGEGNGNPLQCSCLRIPGTGSHRVGHDWSDLAAAAAAAAAAAMLGRTEEHRGLNAGLVSAIYTPGQHHTPGQSYTPGHCSTPGQCYTPHQH